MEADEDQGRASQVEGMACIGVEGDVRWLILRDKSGVLLGGKGRLAVVKQAERQAGFGGRELTLWCPGSPRGVLSSGVTGAFGGRPAHVACRQGGEWSFTKLGA